MKNYQKYKKQYFLPQNPTFEWVSKDAIEKAPIWCSLDLRDGNQALTLPMTLDEKLEFFQTLVKIGFKEIEVAFPAASQTDFMFVRRLIEDNLIPEDVTIQVLTQAREPIIKKTFEALRGAPRAIINIFTTMSKAQREQVFRKSKEEMFNLAIGGAEMLVKFAEEEQCDFQYEYILDSFTGTEPEYALETCNAVLDVWKPTSSKNAIIGLAGTLQYSSPHVYANQVEYISKNLKYRENVVISLHPHNDRGTGVADCELGILAGGDRVEGTLFGNGERAGNADLVTTALNMYAHGVNPKLDFSDMPSIIASYEKNTHKHVFERAPYAGELVFCAFSGVHQDAMTKGLKYREKLQKTSSEIVPWSVPYLPIDPEDLGRSGSRDAVRINSQSGKGGIGFVLEQNGFDLPLKMRKAIVPKVKEVSIKQNKELFAEEIVDIFKHNYMDITTPISLIKSTFSSKESNLWTFFEIKHNKKTVCLEGTGNNPVDAIKRVLMLYLGIEDNNHGENIFCSSHRIDDKTVSYTGIKINEKLYWGASIEKDAVLSTVKSLVSAINNILCDDSYVD